MPRKLSKQEEEETLALITQALAIRQELTDRVVAMVIEASPEIASDVKVKQCLSSMRIIQAALRKVAEDGDA